MSKRDANGLTAYQESVAQAYMISGCKTKSFEDSLYDTSKYSRKSIIAKASAIHGKPEMIARITALTSERSVRCNIDADWVLMEVVDLYKECRREDDRAQANAALKLIANRVDVSSLEEKLADIGGAVRVIQIVGMRGGDADSVVSSYEQDSKTIEINDDYKPSVHRPVRVLGGG